MKKFLTMFFALILPMHLCAFQWDGDGGNDGDWLGTSCCEPEMNCLQAHQMNCLQPQWWRCGWDLEARVGAFRPTSKLFRRIYTHWAPEYELEASKQVWNNIHAWGNVGWYSKHGRSLGLEDHTRIRLIPISFGLKYRYCLTERASVYLGLGACYTLLRTKDYSPFVIHHTHRGAWGGVLKTGLRYAVSCRVFLDFFADYYYQKFHFHDTSEVERHDLNAGGIRLGGGLGLYF